MFKAPIETDLYVYEHLFESPANLEDIKVFEVDKPTGKGLEFYLKNMAEYEERKRSNRTYLVRDKKTKEIAGYFSLRTGLFTLDSGREKESDDDITFYSVPSIELSNFAVNSASAELLSSAATALSEALRRSPTPVSTALAYRALSTTILLARSTLSALTLL